MRTVDGADQVRQNCSLQDTLCPYPVESYTHRLAWMDTRITESFSVIVNTVLGVRQRLVEQGIKATFNRKQ